MYLDLCAFEEILDAVDSEQTYKIPLMLEQRKNEFYEIRNSINKYKRELLS